MYQFYFIVYLQVRDMILCSHRNSNFNKNILSWNIFLWFPFLSLAYINRHRRWSDVSRKRNTQLPVFVLPSGREDEQQPLEDGLPGGVPRRRTQRVGRSLPPAGPRGVGATSHSQVASLQVRRTDNSHFFSSPCVSRSSSSSSAGMFSRLCVWGCLQQHLCVRAHRRHLCQPAVLQLQRQRGMGDKWHKKKFSRITAPSGGTVMNDQPGWLPAPTSLPPSLRCLWRSTTWPPTRSSWGTSERHLTRTSRRNWASGWWSSSPAPARRVGRPACSIAATGLFRTAAYNWLALGRKKKKVC